MSQIPRSIPPGNRYNDTALPTDAEEGLKSREPRSEKNRGHNIPAKSRPSLNDKPTAKPISSGRADSRGLAKPTISSRQQEKHPTTRDDNKPIATRSGPRSESIIRSIPKSK